MDLPSVDPSFRSHHASVVACANTLGDEGILSCLDSLLNVITDGQSIYTGTLFHDGLRQLTTHTPFTFLWMKAKQLMDNPPNQAEYAIQFTAIADRGFQPLALAYLILRFNEVYAEATANLVAITYRFTHGVVYGVFFYDDELDWSYAQVVQGKSVSAMDEDIIWHGDFPVTFWNCTGTPTSAVRPRDHLERYFSETRRLVHVTNGGFIPV